jgi:hypothetical protein
MLLRVKNLGPVREAELDLSKPLIVLTGPNNSGKTYLAWAAYSLARLNWVVVGPPRSLRAWVDTLFESPGQALDLKTLVDVHEETLRAVGAAAHDQLPEDFAAPRDRFQETKIDLSASSDDVRALLTRRGAQGIHHSGHLVAFQFGDERLRLLVDDRNPDRPPGEAMAIADLDGERLALVKTGVAKLAVHVIMGALLDQRYVAFPVERLAINLFARELAAQRTELVDDLLSNASDTIAPTVLRDELQRRAGRYPLVIRDALQSAIRLSDKANVGPLADLADELEARVLGGSIKLDAHDDLKFISKQDVTKTPLGLHESASVVKSLVSLVLYLRYEAKPGQRLVIDEPELNLHPDNQRLVTRILAKAVNRGLKIMMSTHSDYVVRELNNLVMLGQDSDEARKLIEELGYHTDETLRGEQIGAYLVNGGTCTPLPVTETGFSVETIEAEIHKLNHDAQTIYLRLFCQ